MPFVEGWVPASIAASSRHAIADAVYAKLIGNSVRTDNL